MIFTFFPLFIFRGWLCSIMAVSCAKSASAQLTAEDATQAVIATCAAVSMSCTTSSGWGLSEAQKASLRALGAFEETRVGG